MWSAGIHVLNYQSFRQIFRQIDRSDFAVPSPSSLQILCVLECDIIAWSNENFILKGHKDICAKFNCNLIKRSASSVRLKTDMAKKNLFLTEKKSTKLSKKAETIFKYSFGYLQCKTIMLEHDHTIMYPSKRCQIKSPSTKSEGMC